MPFPNCMKCYSSKKKVSTEKEKEKKRKENVLGVWHAVLQLLVCKESIFVSAYTEKYYSWHYGNKLLWVHLLLLGRNAANTISVKWAPADKCSLPRHNHKQDRANERECNGSESRRSPLAARRSTFASFSHPPAQSSLHLPAGFQRWQPIRGRDPSTGTATCHAHAAHSRAREKSASLRPASWKQSNKCRLVTSDYCGGRKNCGLPLKRHPWTMIRPTASQAAPRFQSQRAS